MAAEAGIFTAHATLSGTTVDTVTLSGALTRVTVINRAAAGGADMWVTISTTSTAPSDPVAAADNTYWIPAGGYKTFRAGGNGCIVKILGNSNAYSVEGEQWGAP
jgi:hypothetical protein